MKKGITAFSDYDNKGRWKLCIEKAKGKLTLEEIVETAREYEWDYYLAVIDAYHEPDNLNRQGDYVELYTISQLKGEK